MRTRLSMRVLGAAALLMTLGAVGCGQGAMGDGSSAAENPLIGEWRDVGDGRIEFTEDVVSMSAAQTGQRYRYRIVSDTRMTLEPLVIENGVESVDSDGTRTERYELEGDALVLQSWWAPLYRADSSALREAQDAGAKGAGTGVTPAEARLQLTGCVDVRETHVVAFESWFEDAYPDRIAHGYTIGTYIELKRLDLEWDYATLTRKVGSGYAAAAKEYEDDTEPEAHGTKADTSKIVGWVTEGTCPSGGQYTTEWNLDSQSVPQIGCSVHGE